MFHICIKYFCIPRCVVSGPAVCAEAPRGRVTRGCRGRGHSLTCSAEHQHCGRHHTSLKQIFLLFKIYLATPELRIKFLKILSAQNDGRTLLSSLVSRVIIIIKRVFSESRSWQRKTASRRIKNQQMRVLECASHVTFEQFVTRDSRCLMRRVMASDR